MKKPYLSKTLWVNALVAVAPFFGNVSNYVTADKVMMVLAVVNMALRLVTKEKVQLVD